MIDVILLLHLNYKTAFVLCGKVRKADGKIWGANRTIVAMDYTKNVETIFALNQRFVKVGGDIMCDENPVYKNLDFHYHFWLVNHQET